MKIVNLPPGEAAVAEVDCIRIQELEDAGYELTGNALAPCEREAELESVSIVAGEPYDSFDNAEAAGLAWASALGVRELHVCRSDGIVPLPDPK